eukprot:2626205-Amphidinium_carterae.2
MGPTERIEAVETPAEDTDVTNETSRADGVSAHGQASSMEAAFVLSLHDTGTVYTPELGAEAVDWKNRFKRHLDDDTDIPLKSVTAVAVQCRRKPK